jgi:hypothetical protein
MATGIPPGAFRVVVIRPTNYFLGGDPATNDAAALKYAEFPSGIKITQSSPKNFRKLKLRATEFFKMCHQKPERYMVETRWAFSTYDEALQKMFYEANYCGHFMECQGWCKM